ncbi:hypothetical protein NPX13_g10011 [Xylaria arbuscula]|uniref:Uncharacterized protein n=1 Tax=Xylaria arbuscula TaxID=114810 RepID=A0A9W8N5K8_9PEZI|nr:hypothetical protein NPX13_g10011 [Xylaria arbuscula]
MHGRLEEFLDALRQGPRDLDEDTQLWFVDAIDYEDDVYADPVEILARSVSNICPSLAARLALWYLYHDGFDAALAVTMKVLGEKSNDHEAERLRKEKFGDIVEALQYEINEVYELKRDDEEEPARAKEDVKEEEKTDGKK